MAEEIGFVGEEFDLRVRQGQTYEVLFEMVNPDGTPLDLTGCAVRGQVRRTPQDPAVVAELVGVTTPEDALLGCFMLVLTAAQTAAISAGDTLYDAESQYVYDLELVDALDRVLPLMWGKFRVHREVTR